MPKSKNNLLFVILVGFIITSSLVIFYTKEFNQWPIAFVKLVPNLILTFFVFKVKDSLTSSYYLLLLFLLFISLGDLFYGFAANNNFLEASFLMYLLAHALVFYTLKKNAGFLIIKGWLTALVVYFPFILSFLFTAFVIFPAVPDRQLIYVLFHAILDSSLLSIVFFTNFSLGNRRLIVASVFFLVLTNMLGALYIYYLQEMSILKFAATSNYLGSLLFIFGLVENKTDKDATLNVPWLPEK